MPSWGQRMIDILVGMAGLVVLAVVAPLIASMGLLVTGGSPLERLGAVGQERRQGAQRRHDNLQDRRRIVHPGRPVRIWRWAWPGKEAGRWGQMLRATPMAWNLFKGEVSLFGPRLLSQERFLRLRLQHPARIHPPTVVPGLLGLAQLEVDPDPAPGTELRRVQLDDDYLHRRGPFLHLRILLFSMLDMLGLSRSL